MRRVRIVVLLALRIAGLSECVAQSRVVLWILVFVQSLLTLWLLPFFAH